MTPEQEAHLQNLIHFFEHTTDQKYRKGAAEHGGNLWDNDELTLVVMAIEEAIDQVTYLFTLQDKIIRRIAHEFDHKRATRPQPSEDQDQ